MEKEILRSVFSMVFRNSKAGDRNSKYKSVVDSPMVISYLDFFEILFGKKESIESGDIKGIHDKIGELGTANATHFMDERGRPYRPMEAFSRHFSKKKCEAIKDFEKRLRHKITPASKGDKPVKFETESFLNLYDEHYSKRIREIDLQIDIYIRQAILVCPTKAFVWLALFALMVKETDLYKTLFFQYQKTIRESLLEYPEGYLDQQVSITENEIYDFSANNDLFLDTFFHMINKYPLIVLGAYGGMGKTTFIKMLSAKAEQEKLLNIIYRVNLSDVIEPKYYYPDSNKDPLSDRDYCMVYKYIEDKRNSLVCGDGKKKDFREWKKQFVRIDDLKSEGSATQICFLLDGLNELPGGSDRDRDIAIDDFKTELGKLTGYSNVKVFITVREAQKENISSHIKDIFDVSTYKAASLAGVLDKDYDEIREEIEGYNNPHLEELLRRPLYFLKYKNLPKQKRKGFTSHYEFLNNLSNYEIVNLGKKNIEQGVIALTFYFYVPYIHYCMAKTNTFTINESEMCKLIADLTSKLNIGVYYDYWKGFLSGGKISYFRGFNLNDWNNRELNNKIREIIKNYVCDMSFYLSADGSFKVVHQDYRDAGTARYIKAQIEVLKCISGESPFRKAGTPVGKLVDLDISSMDDDTVDLLVKAIFDLWEIDVTDEKSINEKYGELFVDGICPPNSSIPIDNATIDAVLKLYFFALRIGDFISKVRLKNRLPQYFDQYVAVFQKISEIMERYTDFSWDAGMAIEILCRKIEFLRRGNCFSEALQTIESAHIIDGSKSEDKTLQVKGKNYIRLQHHKAKVYIYWYQYMKKGNIKEEIASDRKVHPREYFWETGLGLLKDCGQSDHLSCNLLGLIYSFPAPIIQGLVEVNYIKAFSYFYAGIFDKNGNERGALTENVYAIRQCAMMLVEGKVKLAEKNISYNNIRESDLRKGPVDKKTADYEENIKLASVLLEKIKRMHIAHKNYLCGCISQYEGKKEEALNYWKKDSSLVAKIRLANEKTSDKIVEDINAELKRILLIVREKPYGEVDKYHLTYVLSDVEKLLKNECSDLEGKYHIWRNVLNYKEDVVDGISE